MASLLSLLFLLPFFPLLLLSSSASAQTNYKPPDKLFINCGSDSNVTVAGRNFVGDVNSASSFFFSFGPSDTSITNSSSGTPLYQTARIFKIPSSYEFNIDNHGIYSVRLHFSAFIVGNTDLGNALFDVSTSNFSLLSKFSTPTASVSPVINEFFLPINDTKFVLHFVPSAKGSFAFVNAIEVFRVPDDFVLNNLKFVSPEGNNSMYNDVMSQVLHTLHRVNVGGPQTTDGLWKNWVKDDDYLISGSFAKECPQYVGTLPYGNDGLGASPYIAPDLVYKTCRELNSSFSNITWRLNVSKSSRHLVRLHFCDIISRQISELRFDLYIYNKFSQLIDPYNNESIRLATPFYWDFVVDSDDSGYLNVSIGPRQDSSIKSAYLNGIEIMVFMKELELVVSKQGHQKKHVFIIVGSIAGGVIIVILAAALILGLKRKKEKQTKASLLSPPSPWPYVGGTTPSWKTSERSRITNPSIMSNLNLNLKISFGEILDATNKFDRRLLIGEGGFGKVYKGTLHSGTRVAVKRSDSNHGQGLPEFETEILILSKIRHRHLVSLIGYCNEGSEMILVYEFMEKGTLREHLYGESGEPAPKSKLSWRQRLEICIGAARGLHYLHSGLDGGIIHRDVKSTNILLDEHYVAKVADFGLSSSGPPDHDHFSVGVKGSFGYIDPEYYKTLEFTNKSDVYSFGVVLLEVLCTRPAIATSTLKDEVNLAEWGMYWLKKGQLEKIIDPFLVGEIKADSFRKFGETVEKCLSINGSDRPSMSDVLWDLEYALQLDKPAVNKEPNEESLSYALSGLGLPLINLQRLPSGSLLFEEDSQVQTAGAFGSDIAASEVSLN